MGEPQRLSVERLDKSPNGPGVPAYCVPLSEEVVDARVVISDFGVAFFQNGECREFHTPIYFSRPNISSMRSWAQPSMYGLLDAHSMRFSANVLYLKVSCQTKITWLQKRHPRTSSQALVGSMAAKGRLFPSRRVVEDPHTS